MSVKIRVLVKEEEWCVVLSGVVRCVACVCVWGGGVRGGRERVGGREVDWECGAGRMGHV